MASVSVDQDQFSCPVCLDLLKDPVTTSCGHSYCMVCINGCWDQEDQRGVYSCPQCRETFTPRPVLRRNNMLAEVVEKLKKTELQAGSPALCYAGPGDVECDSCTGRKRKAIKSCLVCLASYCEAHLKPHYQSPAFKKHKLVEASKQLQEKICSKHDEVMKIYCRTDQQVVCYLCTMDKHRGHDTVAASAERKEKQNELKEEQRRSQQRLQEKEKKLQEVKQAVKTLKSSAQAAVEDSERIFTELIRSIEKKRSEVTELIRAQEEAELSGAEELLEQLEQEIADLKRRDTELEQLSHTEDHIQFLQVTSTESQQGSEMSLHIKHSSEYLYDSKEVFAQRWWSKRSRRLASSGHSIKAELDQVNCQLVSSSKHVELFSSSLKRCGGASCVSTEAHDTLQPPTLAALCTNGWKMVILTSSPQFLSQAKWQCK
uniref:E3 ubiquitin/ISG15 ligase TRIM25-like n=1 Tax=Pygocentrus nattereri TaxID=42514 RepID=A0AAR2L2N4_PYGNA